MIVPLSDEEYAFIWYPYFSSRIPLAKTFSRTSAVNPSRTSSMDDFLSVVALPEMAEQQLPTIERLTCSDQLVRTQKRFRICFFDWNNWVNLLDVAQFCFNNQTLPQTRAHSSLSQASNPWRPTQLLLDIKEVVQVLSCLPRSDTRMLMLPELT